MRSNKKSQQPPLFMDEINVIWSSYILKCTKKNYNKYLGYSSQVSIHEGRGFKFTKKITKYGCKGRGLNLQKNTKYMREGGLNLQKITKYGCKGRGLNLQKITKYTQRGEDIYFFKPQIMIKF